MGKEKYQKKAEEIFKKSPVVGFDSLTRLIKDKKKNSQYQKQFVRNLVLKGKIKKLAKGCYTIFDEVSLSVFCFQPAYLGLQDALSIHNLWEQETIPVIISSKKIRQGRRKNSLGNLLVRRISKKYFFGAEYKKIGDFYLPCSDVEKTLIDLIYFRQKIDNDVLFNIKKKIDRKKLNIYLKKYPERFRNKVWEVLRETK
jgi:predicted transcriptional regulator of viral defense system